MSSVSTNPERPAPDEPSATLPATDIERAIPAAAPMPRPLGPGTLGRRLVVRVTLLVAAVAILLSAGTALATRQLLIDQTDDQLDAVVARAQRADPGGSGGPGQQLVQPGQPIGAFVALFVDGSKIGGEVLTDDRTARSAPLPSTVLSQLSGLTSGTRDTVDLGDFGRYRVSAVPATIEFGPGRKAVGIAVIGLPLREIDQLVAKLIIAEALLTLLATAGAALAAGAVVIRSLRPLNRVAATAQEVSALRLDRGEVAVGVRVPAAEADPTSEVGRVGQALNHLLANVDGALTVRQASETKLKRFVADASHELRNPLAAIRGYAELTRRDRDQLPPDTGHALRRIESESERMSVLVEDLLLLARLDDRPELDRHPVDLTELVINAVSDARVAGPGHRWELELPPEPVTAAVDRHRIHQVIANLLANARTHTPPGTTVVTRLRADVTDGRSTVVIMVTDNGPGISAELADHVFERFTRAESSRARVSSAARGASTGLGLAIVAAVVEAHHGTVSLATEAGATTFTISLPVGPR